MIGKSLLLGLALGILAGCAARAASWQELDAQAQAHFDAGRFEEAADGWRRALAVAAEPAPPIEQSRLLDDLGFAYLEMGDTDSARIALEQALGLKESLLGQTDPRLVSTLMQLAKIYSRTGNLTAAVDVAREVSTILDRNSAPGEGLDVRRQLATLLATGKDFAESPTVRAEVMKLYDEVIDLQGELIGIGHPEMEELIREAEWLYNEWGMQEEAAFFRQEAEAIWQRAKQRKGW